MKTLLAVLQMIPAIIQAVKAAEEMVPLSGKGKEKTDFVIGLISDTVEDVSGLIPTITKVIARIVSLFNSTGQFQKA